MIGRSNAAPQTGGGVRVVAKSFSIPPAAWSEDGGGDYPWICKLNRSFSIPDGCLDNIIVLPHPENEEMGLEHLCLSALLTSGTNEVLFYAKAEITSYIWVDLIAIVS